MSQSHKQIERFTSLIQQGEKIDISTFHPVPNVLYFGTPVDEETAIQWGTRCLNLLKSIFGKESDYYLRFNELFSELGDYTSVRKAHGILKAAKDDCESEIFLDTPTPKPAEITLDVFISYSSLDQEQAKTLYNAIKSAGAKAFLSVKNLNPGDDFANELRNQLIASRELWLIVSPHSLKSEWVLTEWGAAWALRKKIIPILYRCRLEELPDRLRRLQCIDFHEYSDLIAKTFKSA